MIRRQKGIPMTKRQKRRIVIIVLMIILAIFGVERAYNMQDKFHVTALDPSDYGIVDVRLTTWEKLKDFEYLCSVLEENYPFFKVNERVHNIDWFANKKRYKRMIRNTKNDAEYLVALDHILKDLNNGHVGVLGGRGYQLVYEEYYHHYSKLGNPYKYLSTFEIFSNPYVMVRYMFDGSEIHSANEKDKKELLFGDAGLETNVLIDGKLAYMKFKTMANFDSSQEDRTKIKDFLREVKDYEKLIIDIRGNRGGYDSYWKYIVELLIDEPLRHTYYSFFKDSYIHKYDPYKITGLKSINLLDEETLDQFPEEVKTDFDYFKRNSISVNPFAANTNSSDYMDFKGKIYLLVDEDVFSSAEKFASFAKDTGFATLVGQTTGGDRVFQEIPYFSLPKSKFVIRCSRELGINTDGTINMETKTIPHIEVDPTPHEDFTKDKCIQAVIND